jgi:hypothetical protein
MTKDKTCISNDLDGGLAFYPQGVAEENTLYSTLDCELLRNHLLKNDQNLKTNNSNRKLVDIIKLAMNSDYSDNPIIMLVTMK